MIYKKLIKPLADRTAALLVLLLTLPVMLPLTLILALANKGNPFFIQQRPGLLGRPFRIYKLKTMRDEYDSEGALLPDEQRLHGVGALIRKTSLDEIPQLFNVLKGDMSIVGPRPLLMEYLELYTPEQARRHLVKPGITGWSQVNGRNTLEWEKRFAFDVWYVDNQCFSLDMNILGRTVNKVLRAKNISDNNCKTMTKFKGGLSV